MAGHSKWANIQHRKKKQDNKRGKLFTQINRELSIAAREGGGDVDSNPRLRLAIDKANAANMPKDNVERAIKKATGELEGVNYEEIIYEGYASGGIAVLVVCVTDNTNRTVGEVRHAFAKHGGNLGTEGSVNYLFKKIGVLSYRPGANEEEIMETVLDAGAQDVVRETDGSIEVITAFQDYIHTLDAVKEANIPPDNSEITMRAEIEIVLSKEQGKKLLDFIEILEDLDDTQHVYYNAEIPVECYV